MQIIICWMMLLLFIGIVIGGWYNTMTQYQKLNLKSIKETADFLAVVCENAAINAKDVRFMTHDEIVNKWLVFLLSEEK